MYNGTNVSLKQVIWKVMNNPLASDLSYDLAAEYAVESLRLIGAPFVLEDKVTDPALNVEMHKTALPPNIINIKGIKGKRDDMNEFRAMGYATDSFHNHTICNKEDCNDCTCDNDHLSYTLNNGVVFTSFKKGKIIVSYKSFSLDEDGFPLIPNNQKVLLALEYNILYRFLEPLWILGKITDKAFNHISQQKAWYMAAANSDMQIANYDHVESMMNSINRLIVNSDAHRNSFKNMGNKERLKRFN